MEPQAKSRQIWLSALALILWLLTFGLGLQVIASAEYIISLLFVWAGGSQSVVEVLAWPIICVMAIGLMAFMLVTGEYHRKRVGQAESWRLFAWTIAVELSILLLHYFLR